MSEESICKEHVVYNGILNDMESEQHYKTIHDHESYTYVCNDKRITSLSTIINLLDGKFYHKISVYEFVGKVKDNIVDYHWQQSYASLLIPKTNDTRYNFIRSDMIDANTDIITIINNFSGRCDRYMHYKDTNTYSLVAESLYTGEMFELNMKLIDTCPEYYLFSNDSSIEIYQNSSGSLGEHKYSYNINVDTSINEVIVPNYGFISNYGVALALGIEIDDPELKSPNNRYLLTRVILFKIDTNENIIYNDEIDLREYNYKSVRKSASSIIVNKTFDRVCVVNLDDLYYDELDKSYTTYFVTIFSKKVTSNEWIYYGRMNGSIIDPNSIEVKGIDHDDPIHYLTEYHPEYAPHYLKTGMYRNLYISTNDDGFYLNIFVPFIGINSSDLVFDIVLLKPDNEFVTATARIDTIKKVKLYT